MILRVLGCSGAEAPDRRLPAYLLGDSLLLDAGTISAALSFDEQRLIRHVLLTHSHLDHIRGIPLLADNLITAGFTGPVTVHALPETIDALRRHVMNDVIWPDFGKIPPDAPLIRYEPVSPEVTFTLDRFTVTPFPVPHAVPAVGYRIRCNGKTLFYTGDTGPLPDGFWKGVGPVDTLIVEASFPSAQEDLARLTGHLTPLLLSREIAAFPGIPAKIGVVHLKPAFIDTITAELDALGVHEIRVLTENERVVA